MNIKLSGHEKKYILDCLYDWETSAYEAVREEKAGCSLKDAMEWFLNVPESTLLRKLDPARFVTLQNEVKQELVEWGFV